jgi:hypothetical protein
MASQVATRALPHAAASSCSAQPFVDRHMLRRLHQCTPTAPPPSMHARTPTMTPPDPLVAVMDPPPMPWTSLPPERREEGGCRGHLATEVRGCHLHAASVIPDHVHRRWQHRHPPSSSKRSKEGGITTTTNNNQAFYSQASWDRLEMKPHEQKKQVQNKSEKRENKGR